MKNKFFIVALWSSAIVLGIAEINIAPDIRSVEFKVDGKDYKIERTQESDKYLTNEYSLTSRPSPPFFVQPFKVSNKVETYGELEVLKFLREDDGIFIDARLEDWYKKSYIPGSINIPFKIFLTDSPKRDVTLMKLGAKKLVNGTWSFKNAETILLYCNGAWCGQSPTAIKALIEIGYPEEKMKYYRGGMQSWQLLGLSIVTPKKGAKK